MKYSRLGFYFFALATLLSSVRAHAETAPHSAWTAKLNVPVYNPPQAVNGHVYLTSMQSSGPNVFALNGKNGKLVGSFATKGAVAIPPTVGDTQLFIASDVEDTHYMRALNAATGAVIWEYTRDQPPQCMCSYQSTLADGILFAQTDGHGLFAFQPLGDAPSRRLWSYEGNGALLTNSVTANGMVVIGSADRHVYGLDAKTGKVLLQQTTGYAFTADPVIVDDVAVIGDQGGNIDGFALKTGKQLWTVSASGAIDNAAVIEDHTAFLVAEDHNLYALDVTNGKVRWQYKMEDFAAFPPVATSKAVIVDNRSGQLIALDVDTGKSLWQADLNGTAFSSPVLWAARNAVVVKVGDHEIAAFGLRSGKKLWRFKTKAVVTLPVIDGKNVDVATSQGAVLAIY